MTASKNMLIDSMRMQLLENRMFEEANLSFLMRMRNLHDVQVAHEKAFNLLAKKQLTPSLLNKILTSLKMYGDILEKVKIEDISSNVIDLTDKARMLCSVNDLPINIKEEKVEDNKKIDLSFYTKALQD